MSAALIMLAGGLAAVGVYLVTSRVLSRIVLGFAMLGHAVVVALITAGGPAGEPPLADQILDDLERGDAVSNPLPQALSLTAIVIAFGLTLFLLALARRQKELSGDDLVEDDLEDRRVAAADRVAEGPPTDEFDETVDEAETAADATPDGEVGS